MHPRRFAVAVFSVALALGCSPDSGEDTLAIRGVTVIPGDGGAPLPGATVVVRGRFIEAVGVGVEPPPGATVVEGEGRYLIPGLFEMHAHTSKTRASALGLYIANGVTTVRDAGGDHEELLAWRNEIRTGERPGPRLLIAGPYLESADNVARMRSTPPAEMVEPVERTRIPVGDPERARFVIDSLSELELDFLKIRTVQDAETYRAIGAAAESHGLRLTGHTFGISPEQQLQAGQDGVDHFLFPTLDSLTRSDRMALWERFAERGVVIVPTLYITREAATRTVESFREAVADSLGEIDARRRYVSRFLLLDWREQALEATDRRELYRRIYDSTVRNVREMHEAGVRVLPGTDVAVVDVYPGFSLHDELRVFVEDLELSEMETLVSATSESAAFLGIADSVGAIAPGMIADLVLLDADPLEDISNTTRIAGVFAGGAFFDRAGLERILEDVDTAPDQSVNDWPRSRGESR